MTDPNPITISGRTWTYDPTSNTHKPADATTGDRAAVQAANTKRPKRNALAPPSEGYAFDSRVDIEVHSFRVHSQDTDGISIKAALDRLTHCGVIRNDTPKEVASIKYIAPVKVETEAEERTVLILETEK